MAAVKFKVGNYASYSALQTKDTNTLYFITDAKKNFKVSVDVTESIEIVSSSFPTYANAFEGKFYIKPSTLEVKIKESGKEALTTLIPGYVTSSSDVIAANNDKIPTVSALIAYVAAQFSAKTTLAGYGITDAKIENGTITLGSDTITPITVVDSSFVADSTNPVQSKVVKAALDNKLETSLKGATNGLAELDSTGKVPSTQLPSYVDDVVEGYFYNSKFYKEAAHTTEITAESGKIYVNLAEGNDQNKTYRWSGSAYVVISETLALGETSSTAYRGDRGKTAYDHSQVTSGNPHNVSKSDVGLNNVTNDKQVKAIQSSTSGDIVTFGGTDGATIADSGKTIGGSTLASTPSANTLATEAAVAAAISAAVEWESI